MPVLDYDKAIAYCLQLCANELAERAVREPSIGNVGRAREAQAAVDDWIRVLNGSETAGEPKASPTVTY